MKEAAVPSGTIYIPFMQGAAGPFEKIHISFIKAAAAPSITIEIPSTNEVAGMLGISFMKEAAAPSGTMQIPFMKGAAGPLEKIHYILHRRGGCSCLYMKIPFGAEAAGTLGISFMKG